MKTGTTPKQGDIVLIPIPFTDLTSQKRRPVIVVSNNHYNDKKQDVVVVALTSNPQATDFSFLITSSNLSDGKLNRPSRVRVDKIYTMSQAIIVKTFGRVDAKTLDLVRATLRDLFSGSEVDGD